MYLNLNKAVGPVTGKWCIRSRSRTVTRIWDVYDGFGVWWGSFGTFPEARDYVVAYEDRWDGWRKLL